MKPKPTQPELIALKCPYHRQCFLSVKPPWREDDEEYLAAYPHCARELAGQVRECQHYQRFAAMAHLQSNSDANPTQSEVEP